MAISFHTALLTNAQDRQSRLNSLPAVGPLEMVDRYIVGPQFPGTINIHRPLAHLKTLYTPDRASERRLFPKIALDNRGNLVVADPYNQKIEVRKQDGTVIQSTPIVSSQQILVQMAVGSNGNMYTTWYDKNNYLNPTPLKVFQSQNLVSATGWWDRMPAFKTDYWQAVAVTADGSVLLTNTEDSKNVQVYGPSGNPVCSLQVDYPVQRLAVNLFTGDIAVGGRQFAYCSRRPGITTSKQVIFIFDKEYKLKQQIYGNECEDVQIPLDDGGNYASCRDIFSMAFDAAGTLVVSDPEGIKYFSSDGKCYESSAHDLGCADVTVNEDGQIIAAEKNGRISIWGHP